MHFVAAIQTIASLAGWAVCDCDKMERMVVDASHRHHPTDYLTGPLERHQCNVMRQSLAASFIKHTDNFVRRSDSEVQNYLSSTRYSTSYYSIFFEDFGPLNAPEV